MTPQEQQAFDDLKRDVQALKDAQNAATWSFETDLTGLVETVTTDPSTTNNVPKAPFDQIKIYKTGSTWKLYLYDYQNHVWKSVTIA